jgi:hypothetical protein
MPSYTSGNYASYIGAGLQVYSEDLTAATGTTAGGVVSLANPLGAALIIHECYLNITTAATTATNTIDVGVAANGTTSSDTLLDGKAAAAGLFSADNDTDNGTNGGVPRRWGATEYVTGTASATLAGMVGTIHIVYSRA